MTIQDIRSVARPGAGRLPSMVAVLVLGSVGGAAGFPLVDTGEDQMPSGTELAAPDAQDLRHQLQIVNGLGAPAGGGWTFVPRIDLQELLTDNVAQAHSPRQWDLATYVAPGFSLAGDLPRVQLTLSYAPTLAYYTRDTSLNALTQQLSALGNVTLVPDLAFVDVRALSGVQSQYGGLGGLGTVGASAGAGATAQAAIPTLAGNSLGLTRDNETQTSSFGVSPYLLRRFGDWGVGRLGYSLNVTRSAGLSGFASPPIPTGGINGQTLVTNEETAHFVTGDILQSLQNAVDVDLQQGLTTVDPPVGANDIVPGAAEPNSTTTSRRAVASDTVTYVVNRNVAVFASAGHEDIRYVTHNPQALTNVSILVGPNGQETPFFNYTNTGPRPISDWTWSIGTTLTPNPDSAVTISYGHQDGFNSLSVNGHYAVTGRTMLTASYGSTLGTQLENLQNQLNLATSNGTGTLVNGQTGGSLFGSTNALATQDGVFRTDTLTLGSTTSLDRDIVSLSLLLTRQTGTGGTNSTASTSKTVNATWLHQMRPDMTVSAALSYALTDQSVGTGVNPGNSTSIVASVAWQYQISDTVSASLRYSLLDRSSAVAAFSVYQNLLILGISKSF